MSSDANDISSSRSCQDMLEKFFSLSDCTVILTGGARGIGLQLLKTLLTAGADVACLDILAGPAPDRLHDLKLHAGAEDSWVCFYKCDVTDEAAVEQTLADVDQKATQRCRPIKGLVNCAGIQMAGDALKLAAEDFRQVIDVNVTGSFLVARQTAKVMRRNGTGGSLLLIASMAAHAANRGINNCNYNASKAGVLQLGRSLAQEWGKDKIRVNTLSPGYLRTDMTQELLDADPELKKLWLAGAMLGRLGEVTDLEAAVLFLLGDGSRFMTGADLKVDGGNTAAV
ncbi:hypothetical protein LCI18_000255 [Fusarium solani-melongenae]|uniref:Uncharacterized protein n=1 Tax=Fusarium solani subsp. cucurbitae TaxID=2747967 RepID=A0ACD3YKC1_FUSSC|nr:hypothetical protein LCI18_000255 [Fusarium solani-melongenae]